MTTRGNCQDCGKDISPGAKRCRSCDNKHRWAQPKYKERASASLKRTYSNPEVRAKTLAQLKRTHNTPEYKAKMSTITRAQWAEPNSTLRQAVSSQECKAKHSASWQDPKMRRNHLEGFAKCERRKASIPELRVKEFLEANFDEVIHQYVPDESMPIGIYDFYISDIDTLVEVDGCYWHSKEDSEKRDLEKEVWALQRGYGFVRIEESDAKDSRYLLSLLKELLVMIKDG